MTGLAYPMWAGLTPGSRVSVTADATLREARGSRGREGDGEEGILGWERGILGGRERGREGGILGGGGGGGGGRFFSKLLVALAFIGPQHTGAALMGSVFSEVLSVGLISLIIHMGLHLS